MVIFMSENTKRAKYLILKYLALQSGGSGEIRTHGRLQTVAGFQDRCIQPLCHTSFSVETRRFPRLREDYTRVERS